MNDPVIESIKRQRRTEIETHAREAFNTFHHDIAPYKKKAADLLKSFSPLALAAQSLASEASSIQDPPQRVAGLIQDILVTCQSVPQRVKGALAEIDSLTVNDFNFDPDHESKYREGEARFSRLVFNLNPGDVCRSLAANTAELRYQLKALAESAGVDSLVTIPAAPISDAPATVRVNTNYSPLKR